MSITTETILECDHCKGRTKTLDPIYPSLWRIGWLQIETMRGFPSPGNRTFCSLGCMLVYLGSSPTPEREAK